MVFGLLFWIVGNIFALAFEQDDPLAQQVEHIPFKDGVLGSNPKRITEKSLVAFQRGIFCFSSVQVCVRLGVSYRLPCQV